MGNNAVAVNPPSYAIDITEHGSDWLWAVFCIMAATGLALTVMTAALPTGKRAFHYFGVIILFTASVAYFSMASNLGKTGIPVEFNRIKEHLYTGNDSNPLRSIWYARYIDWTITTPFLLLTILLGTGLPSSDIAFTVFMDLVMIETGLIGALVFSRYKFGFFAFGCAAMLYVFWILIGPARSAARNLGADVQKAYTNSAIILSFLWFLYPIAWGLCDGGNVISPDSEMIFYGILDVLAKPCFILFHLFQIKNIDYERFMLQSGHFSVGANEKTVRHENVPLNGMKHPNVVAANEAAANGHSNGHSNGNGVA